MYVNQAASYELLAVNANNDAQIAANAGGNYSMSNPADNKAMGIHNMNTALFFVKEDNDTGKFCQGKLPQNSDKDSFSELGLLLSALLNSGICCVGFEKET